MAFENLSTLTISQIIILVALIFIICCAGGYNIHFQRLYPGSSKGAIVVMFTSILILIITAQTLKISLQNDIACYKETCIQNCLESGYTFYLDGEKIDATTISAELYQFSVNEEAKEVYMAR